jgi:hypothetical protein
MPGTLKRIFDREPWRTILLVVISALVFFAFYRVHPALYTECDEILENLEITREDLNACLVALEADNHVALYRKRGTILLAKATYEGLRLAKPQEFYLKFPDFVDREREAF